MSEFMKDDGRKCRLELVEPSFFKGVGWVLTFGANKYGQDNWKEMEPADVERIKGAMLRHTLAYMDGEKLDPESGMPHLWHTAANTMFLDYFERRAIERDDTTEDHH